MITIDQAVRTFSTSTATDAELDAAARFIEAYDAEQANR